MAGAYATVYIRLSLHTCSNRERLGCNAEIQIIFGTLQIVDYLLYIYSFLLKLRNSSRTAFNRTLASFETFVGCEL